jgi:hypothetical protein
MVIEKMIEAGMQAFKKNLEAFCGAASEQALCPDSAQAVAYGLQPVLAVIGAAVYRAFLESKEVVAEVAMRDDEVFRFKYTSDKTFLSLWGPMSVTRRVYQNASDTRSYVPLDTAWGMQDEYMTMEVREAVAFACAHVTPEETAELLEKSALFHPHPTQIKRAVEALCDDLSPRRTTVDAHIRRAEQKPAGARVLAASMDGANVLLREDGGAKRGRPAERPGQDHDQSDTTAYKNAMVGSVSYYGSVLPGEKTPQRLSSRYVSHMPEDRAVTFKTKFEAELDAAEAHASYAITKVLICDGARSIWNYVEESGRYCEYEKLIDYWHTLEHLSLAAEAVFGKGTKQARFWYGRYARLLLENDDGAQRTIRSMAYFEIHGGLSAARKEDLATQQTFFTRNQRRMTYANFRRRGLPIGSGPVEAACKSLVKNRLCRSGMRWTRKGGQRILDLRTYVKSNRWDAFWTNYNALRNAA